MKEKLVGLAIVGLCVGYGLYTEKSPETKEIAMSSCTRQDMPSANEPKGDSNKCTGPNGCGTKATKQEEESKTMAPKRKSAAQKIVYGSE